MDAVMGVLSLVFWVPVIIIVLIAALVFFRLRYKIAKSNQALVISGGRRKPGQAGPIVLVSGGAFVSPFRRHEFFPLAVMTVVSDDRETQTKTVVPVVVKWTAQLKPDTETEGALAKAVMGFIGKSDAEIKESLQQTLEGEVRAVVATLTPEEVIEGRDKFKNDIETNVETRMVELGYKLISLNITEVRDNQGHYENLAAKDREEKRRVAENLKAEEEQSIAETAAKTGQASESARLIKELAVAEKERDLRLKRSEYQAETDKAAKDADYAGKIREQERQKELAVSQGAVAVEEENQKKAAAEARRSVVTTEAETAKEKQLIEARAAAEQAAIDADARVVIAEKDADAGAKAAERKAIGEAVAAQKVAEGRAVARKTEAEAEAEAIRQTREANAAGIAAEGRAEAEAIREKGLAEAEAEKAKAEALAEKEGVNLKLEIAKIESETRIKVSTAIATAVAEVGTNATIIDLGGGSGGFGGAGGGDLLNRILGDLPGTLKKLEVQNAALNGKPLFASVNELVAALKNEPAALPETFLVGEVVKTITDEVVPVGAGAGTGVDVVGTGVGAAGAGAARADAASAAVLPPVVAGGMGAWAGGADAAAGVAAAPELAVGSTLAADALATPSAQDRQAEIYGEQKAAKAAHAKAEQEEQEQRAQRAAAAAAEDERALQDREEAQELAALAEKEEVAPVATPEDQAAVNDLVKNFKLNAEEAIELAQVYASVKDSSAYTESEAHDLVLKSVRAVKEMHRSGEKVDPKAVARVLVDTDSDGSVGSEEIINLVADFAKKAANKRRR